MWKHPRIRKLLLLSPILIALVGLWGIIGQREALSGEQSPKETERPRPSATDIVFQGKLTASLVRVVAIPVQGTIREIKAASGKPVKEGEVLARYQLSREAMAQIQRRLSPPQISDLKMRLATVERGLTALGSKQREIRQLAAENMAPAQSVTLVEQEIELAKRELGAIQERLALERRLAQEDLDLLRHQLAVKVEPNKVPSTAALVSPITGHAISMHPELREGAELPPGTPCFTVGVMDPVLMKAQVHEIEAVRLSVGIQADITVESLPEQKFQGTISRLSWAPRVPGLEQPTFYEVELSVPNPNLVLRDGLKGQAVIRPAKN
ncbi:MAG: HlyD family secretion protein [Syntrophobacteraceae bacterium]